MEKRKLAAILKVDIENLDLFKIKDLQLLNSIILKKHIEVKSMEVGKKILTYFFFYKEWFLEHLILDQLEPYSLEYEILENKIKQLTNKV